MRKLILAVLVISASPLFSQKKPVAEIEKMVLQRDVEAPLTFLAADEMRGRNIGSQELDITANYIATNFQQLGLKAAPGTSGYFQPVELMKTTAPAGGELKFMNDAIAFKDQFVSFNGIAVDWNGEMVFVGYGGAEDMPSDVRGKVVVAIAGTKEPGGPQKIFAATAEKSARVKAGGGVGLVEFFVTLPFPWPAVVKNLASVDRVEIKNEEATIPVIWMKDSDVPGMKELKEKKHVNGSVKVLGSKSGGLKAKNVAAWLEGKDAVLKNEILVISAHFDHVGVGPKKDQDSIYNGARDNALGTTALLNAARYFAKFPPKRSVLFLALTAEEEGLLGSEWYAAHPMVPLKQTVFDLDCDGAGYNDITITTVVGLERTTADSNIKKACNAFGLMATQDPVPEQNLYERSDNYNFAKMGVPAVDFAPGVKAFDQELMKYYHQPADEVKSLDFNYLVKYVRAFVYAAHLIANDPKTPTWVPGDKFEPVGKALYQR